MTVGRALAGAVSSFAAGIITASAAGTHSCGSFLPLACCSASVCTLLLFRNAKAPSYPRCIAAALSMFCSGFLCLYTAKALSPSYCSLIDILKHSASATGDSMAALIEALPFEDADAKGLAKAFITGRRDGVSPSVSKAFRHSGASHLLALSGFHLGIIYSFLNKILALAGNAPAIRKARAIIIMGMCCIYTFAAGAGESLVRALIFILTAESGRLTGRPQKTGHILFASFTIQCILSPTSISSAGFQLSYAAMSGIIFIYPFLERLFPADPQRANLRTRLISVPARKIWQLAALSTACQIATAPIAWLHFGRISTNFLTANLTALPLVGIIIPLTLVTAILNMCGLCPETLITATERSYILLIEIIEAASMTP